MSFLFLEMILILKIPFETRIPRNVMSHLITRLYIRRGVKASVWHIFGIHLVVHKIMSVLYFALFLVIEILAFRQNWTRKQEVDHCDLILQSISFQFDNSQKQDPINASFKISAKCTMPFWRKS